MNKLIILLTSFILFVGCGNQKDMLGYDDYLAIEAPTEESNMIPISSIDDKVVPTNTQQDDTDRIIIKDGYIEIKSQNIQRSKLIIDSLINKYDCYLSSERYEETSSQWGYYFTVRIYSDQFNQFMNSIENGPDIIRNKSINSSDVTEQYYDLKTRLENNLSVEKRYLELLNKAITIKDILEIETSIGNIRGEIESQQGRLNRLNNQIKYSTLDIYLFQQKTLKQSNKDRDLFIKRLGKSLKQGWLGFVDFIIGIFKIWPVWLIGIVTWRLVVYFQRRRKTM